MRRLNAIVVVAMVLVFSSCVSDELSDAFSERGAENDKNILLDSSDALYSEIVQLGVTDFAEVSHSMHQRISNVELSGNGQFVEALIGLGQLMYEAESSDCYFDELMDLTFDKEYYCNVLYAEGTGVWHWDAIQNNFVKTEEHDTEVIFIFPATDNVEGDMAVLSITELTIYDGLFPGKGSVLEDGTVINNALEALRFNIKVNDELILTSNVLSTFSTSGYYDDVAMTFNPTPYNLKGEMARTDDKGYWVFAFSNDDELILNQDFNLSIDINNEQMPISSIDNDLQIKNIVIETAAHTGKLYNELLIVDELTEGSEEHATSLASVLNTYADMFVRYSGDNSIIAKVDAVTKFDADKSNWWVDLEFEFSDGSRVSGDEFFDDYLTNFKLELEHMVGEFGCKFGI
ncbi:hypothetical protein J1N10_02835 [Carboxylicivirga sp. A043]|uniref:hypothetical protein n=1 Tax=Carboxylicivirga litoralis TaxID=2816963 RepID=UPI0021CB0341|nr:hypothetical protein [Carboxylicivirga sp. A043]MCU4154894.1 hypothetical protein [Carboxylicivirga sp. A043]